jgi:hypothetical protein
VKIKMEQFPAKDLNFMLTMANRMVLYSNVAGNPLLYESGVVVGEKLPSGIEDFVQRVISPNSPEKIEVKAGKKVYLIAFYPLPKEERVNISGLDISDQKVIGSKFSFIGEINRDEDNRGRGA